MIYVYPVNIPFDSGDLKNDLNIAKIDDITYDENQVTVVTSSDLSEEEITAIESALY